ncbi:MAG: hypothetical protein GY855_13910, partial [candidate division Zixibacteria bacterium]|nr:hypothetical protein [candidate division Zixibacteria bacterium]
LGTAYFRQNKYLDAEKQLSLALKTFEVLKDSLNLAGCAQLSASVKWAVGDYDSANTLARSAADYFKKHSDRKGYLDSKLVEALILIYSGFKEEGEKLLIHGYAKADSIRSKQHKTAFAGNLGRLYLRNDSLSKALDFFKFAIEYSEDKEAILEDRLEILIDLAYSAGLHEGYQVSLSYFANAESLSIKLNNEYYRNKIILLRAAVMEHDSDFNAAIKLLREKITITEIEKYPDLDWRKQYLEGLCKYKNGKPKIAFLILKRSAKILASQPVIPNGELLRSRLPFHPADVFELLAQCRFEMEEYQKALNNFQKASQYRQVSITSGFRVKYNDSTIDSLVSIITSSQLKYFAGMRYNNGRVN